ncbi:MAE_28990/MAE_18760 family HEPN-like nuclease [Pseudarthrobacter sp. TAF60_1]|uniref:MAE_28990/MAE_18760 family HEPN-like nuclease n=1 Tax=Pseudarthrobacter sp. TAF60_1 TaxID=3233071 RepID=UPI003F960BAD
MTSTELVTFFDERHAEIEAYLALLQNLEDATRGGTPRFKETDAAITVEQKKILSSSLYLQLYNLVEATVSRCLDGLAVALVGEGLSPGSLNPDLRREWVRSIAKTHSELNHSNRLEAALELCNHLLSQLPVSDFKIESGGGGNWDDAAIEKVCERVGCSLAISQHVSAAAKRHRRDEMGALKLVKNRRNSLAHGSLSFVDCSDGVSVMELRDLANAVGEYLREAVNSFVNYIEVEIRGNVPLPQPIGATS